MTVLVTQPGVYNISDADYHADPLPGGSLSSSGAKVLLDCPARFRHAVDNPRPPKHAFDIGHAAHRVVLGTGPDLVVVDADDWRKKAAQEQRDAAYAAGAVPLLTAEHDQVKAMAAALQEHPVASALFAPGHGHAEQSLFWVDPAYEVWRRARLDWLPGGVSSAGRMIIPDYKTTVRADLDSIQKAIHNYRYYQQAAWYIDAVQALGLAERPVFVFVFQEKVAPFLVTVVELDAVALRLGRDLNRQALQTYRDCRESGRWPGYSDAVELIQLPAWVENRLNRQEIW